MIAVEQYFRSFKTEHLGKLTFDLLPLSEDIPEYEKIKYDPDVDILEIIFKCDNPKKELKIDEMISLFVDTKTKFLAGIKITGTDKNKIGQIHLIIRKEFEDIVKRWEKEIEQEKKWENQLKLLSQFSIEKRKIDYFENVVSKDLPELIRT